MAASPATPGLSTPDLQELLRRTFGHSGFRAHQREVCEAATSGRDVLLVMPTGAGKSLCYQIPALARGGTALVISPLIALMDDQAAKLQAANLRVARIHSGLSRDDARQACRDYLNGDLDFLLIAPERLRVPGFPEMLARRKPTLVAIDEAHCISQWGHDFRPDYRTLGRHLPALRPAPIIALTATATPSVQQDIVRQLALEDPAVFITGFRRDNLRVEVLELSKPERPMFVEKLLGDPAARPAIVYAPSRKTAEEFATRLGSKFPSAAYHAGLDPNTRERVQRAFLGGKLEVVVATVAFGMGVDKADVRTVVHVALPGSVEGYYQEIGRAGRDGLPSRTVLLHSFADRKTQEFLLEKSYPQLNELEKVAAALDEEFLLPEDLQQRTRMNRETLDRCLEKLFAQGVAEADMGGVIRRAGGSESAWQREYGAQVTARRTQLDRMIAFAENPSCRMAALVRHFGDMSDAGRPCGACDVCRPEHGSGAGALHQPSAGERRDLRTILAALERGNRSTGQLFKDLELNADRRVFDGLVDALARAGLVTVSAETFRTPDGRDVGFRKVTITAEGREPDDAKLDTVWLRDAAGKKASRSSSSVAGRSLRSREAQPAGEVDRSTWTEAQTAFGERIREWRRARAAETGKPPFIVFGDRVLEQLVERPPRTISDLEAISGLGAMKIDTFGAELLAVCRNTGPGQGEGARPVTRQDRSNTGANRPASVVRAGQADTPPRPQVVPAKPKAAPSSSIARELTADQQALEERLRAWRRQEAQQAGLPSFFIFSDTVLRSIALAAPRSLTELRELQGVGVEKIARFGESVLELCRA